MRRALLLLKVGLWYLPPSPTAIHGQIPWIDPKTRTLSNLLVLVLVIVLVIGG
ncbi:MAG: hypothetical protein WD873_08960 [Candidatus Hydrogenedentales bacterium]